MTDLPGVLDAPLNPNEAVPVATQVKQYLAKGPINANAIYTIQGGGNDFFYQFGLLAAGAATPGPGAGGIGPGGGRSGQAGRHPAGRRRSLHRRLDGVRRRYVAFRSGLGPGRTADRAFQFLQHDADVDAERRRRASNSRQYVRAPERDPARSGNVRIEEHHRRRLHGAVRANDRAVQPRDARFA